MLLSSRSFAWIMSRQGCGQPAAARKAYFALTLSRVYLEGQAREHMHARGQQMRARG